METERQMRLNIFALALVLVVLTKALSYAGDGKDTEIIWSGKIELTTIFEVQEGSVLKIMPGTEVSAAANSGVSVRGGLTALGTAEAPIRFRPAEAKGTWQGLSFEHAKARSDISYMEIKGAGIAVAESMVTLRDTAISGAEKGIVSTNGGDLTAERLKIVDCATNGILIFVGSRAVVTDARVERIKGAGIEIGQRGEARISGCQLSECKVGLVFSGDSSVAEKNTIQKCDTGILAIQAGASSAIRGNTVTECTTGIYCRQFSTPLVTENIVRKCKDGIACFQSSSPMILKNLIEKNDAAISAIQICNPVIEKNLITGNKIGIYLTLSSYPVIKSNNFDQNTLSIELDNQSADWEKRVSLKTPRGLAARNKALVEKGRAVPEEFGRPEFITDEIDATGNWWGAAATKEMDEKGESANIQSIKDFFDVPYRKYEGYEGEYRQDKVRYAKWLKEQVADAGPTPKH